MRGDTSWGRQQLRRWITVAAIGASLALLVSVGEEADAAGDLEYAVVAE
ncbi:hypothetical protein [Nocardioides jishulii]|nr:hypothetical protein [Nocardioides jishulii]